MLGEVVRMVGTREGIEEAKVNGAVAKSSNGLRGGAEVRMLTEIIAHLRG